MNIKKLIFALKYTVDIKIRIYGRNAGVIDHNPFVEFIK